MLRRTAASEEPMPERDANHTEKLSNYGRLRIGRPTLRIAAGASAGRVVHVKGEFNIGSGPGMELRLEDRGVSRRHAVLEIVEDRVLIKDLQSTNGTLVNGVPIREAFLTPGDLITIGDCRLRFEPRQEDVAVPPSTRDQFGELFGASLPMRQLFGYLERVSGSDATVLIQGETGTGKELVARALHESSKRKAAPFVAFDCSTVTAELMAAELFGHKEGAFTGAVRSRTGAFSAANKGTLFLDEIGELPLDVQPMLLRALETREIRPVGSPNTIPVDIRVLAATHRDISTWVSQGKFREDLYYRLAVLHVVAPPLRERREDIEGLAKRLLARVVTDRAITLTPDAIEKLAAYSWPGNVRELRNVLERSAALLMGDSLGPEHLFLPSESRTPTAGATDDALDEVEKAAVLEMLERVGGNKMEAARRLKIHRSTLHKKLKKWLGEDAGDEND
jgi:DNA-binding NtrC family response regulator